jgi:hypothetical protein
MIRSELPGNERRAPDRRAGRRYGIRLDVEWKLVHRNRVLAEGTGRTRDVSSHGVSFEVGAHVASGKRHERLELSIAWPVLLHEIAPIRLVASGQIVRWDGTCAALRIRRYEFRTARRTAAEPAVGLANAPLVGYNPLRRTMC